MCFCIDLPKNNSKLMMDKLKKHRNTQIPQTNNPTSFFRHFSAGKTHHASLSTHQPVSKPPPTEETPEMNTKEDISISLENFEAPKELIDKADDKVMTIESFLKQDKDKGQGHIKSISNFIATDLSSNTNILSKNVVTSLEDQKNIESNLKLMASSTMINNKFVTEKSLRSKSITKRPSPSPERSIRSSRRSVMVESRSIKSSGISSPTKNSRTFNDFTNELYFNFRKSNESLKKSSFRKDDRVLSTLRAVEKDKFDGIKDDLSVICDEKQGSPHGSSSEERRKAQKNKESLITKPKPKKTVPKLNLTPSTQPHPKYYHHHITKTINSENNYNLSPNFKKESVYRKNYVKDNCKIIHSARKANKSTSKTKRTPSQSKHVFQINPPTTLRPKTTKEEAKQLYIDLLRKLELLRFTSNIKEISEDNRRKREPSINIETIKLETTPNNIEAYEVICAKYGRDYYAMLNRIFTMYAIHKQNTLLINLRQFNLFLKDFFPEGMHTQILTTQVEILYRRIVKTQEFGDLKAFIGLLFEFCKLRNKKIIDSPKFKTKPPNNEINNNNSTITKNEVVNTYYKVEISKDQAFKRFLDEEIIPKYKNLCGRVKEHGFDKIQIFFQPYEESENPILDLLLEKENLLKHIFSVYETLDIKVSKQSFIDLKGFLRFCSDYSIIPQISNSSQITKMFMTYKKYETNTIDYACFVILVCCIAHISNKTGKIGFLEKMKKFLLFLEKNNEKISEKLVLNKLLN